MRLNKSYFCFDSASNQNNPFGPEPQKQTPCSERQMPIHRYHHESSNKGPRTRSRYESKNAQLLPPTAHAHTHTLATPIGGRGISSSTRTARAASSNADSSSRQRLAIINDRRHRNTDHDRSYLGTDEPAPVTACSATSEPVVLQGLAEKVDLLLACVFGLHAC